MTPLEAHLNLLSKLRHRVRTHYAPEMGVTVKGKSPKDARPVLVDGVRYPSVSEAGRALGVTRMAVFQRVCRGTAFYDD